MTPIWHCSPLIEAEFYEAIKENYFSANKFNFGLSEKQVRSFPVEVRIFWNYLHSVFSDAL